MTAAVRAPHLSAAGRPLRLVGAAGGVEAPAPTPDLPPLRLVPGGRDAAARHRRSPAVYRRRRLVACLLALVVVTALLSGAATLEQRLRGDGTGAGRPEAVAPAAAQLVAGRHHVVQQGDTPWSIARELRPEGEIRPLVDELVERAGGPGLVPGQRLDLTGLAP